MTLKIPTIFERSIPSRIGYSLPALDIQDIPLEEIVPPQYLRKNKAHLPEVSENDLVRHYISLSQMNYHVDKGFYPLGSCTMKYNPKINETLASQNHFTQIHPLQPKETVQGSLQLMYDLQEILLELTGMDAISLQPAAGAQGELTGLMLIKAYHAHNKENHRTKILIPDSAHGTNPASASLLGFEVITLPSNSEGLVDIDSLKKVAHSDIAGLMLTNPNTLGLFEKQIIEIADIIHSAGGLLYYDGANFNAIVGIATPGNMGFDIAHLNLHKTFSTPHGGGGPGSGPVVVKKHLAPFLPKPLIKKKEAHYYLDYNLPQSIGKVKSYYGQFGVLVRAYCYLLTLGREIKNNSQIAVLNANYLKNQLKTLFHDPFTSDVMHEFVLSASNLLPYDFSALDLAKGLVDKGIHPPTIYFPLIIKESLMFEPTETESKETLDLFASILSDLIEMGKITPQLLKDCPQKTIVGRLNETLAARKPIVRYSPPSSSS